MAGAANVCIIFRVHLRDETHAVSTRLALSPLDPLAPWDQNVHLVVDNTISVKVDKAVPALSLGTGVMCNGRHTGNGIGPTCGDEWTQKE